MATQLDLQEQEQLDAAQGVLEQYGNLITWTLVLVLAGFAAWNGWKWWQRDQARKAGAMFDELDRAAEAGDATRPARIFADLKERYPRTAYAQQGGLLAAKVAGRQGPGRRGARRRWPGSPTTRRRRDARPSPACGWPALLLDAKQYDDALKTLDGAKAPSFEALVADRRGDVLLAQGKTDEARSRLPAGLQGDGRQRSSTAAWSKPS